MVFKFYELLYNPYRNLEFRTVMAKIKLVPRGTLPEGKKERRNLGKDIKEATLAKLSPRQLAFAESVVMERGFKNLSDIAMEAGYGKGNRSSAQSTATVLLKNPKIQKAIAVLSEQIHGDQEVTLKKHQQDLTILRNKSLEAGNYAAAITAEVNKGKASGLYLNQSVHLHSSIDSMNKETVLEELAKLKKKYHSAKEEAVDAEYSIISDPTDSASPNLD